MPTYKPTRQFSASEGQKSTLYAGPDQIEKDLDKLCKMFDPAAEHDDGTAGGISRENINFDVDVTDKVIFVTPDIKYVRLNQDKVIETSQDGEVWQATGSSGHVIIDKNGTILPQRSRMKFTNSAVTDDGAQTIVNGIKGDKGDKGDTGERGPQGIQGIQGKTGPVIIPSIDSNGIMSFTIQETAIEPNSVSVRGPQGPQGVQGAQGATGPHGPQGIQGVKGVQGIQGIQGETGPQGPIGPAGPQGPIGPQGQKGDDGAAGRSFTVKALYPTLFDLQSAHPVGADGDAYAVGSYLENTIYIWDVDLNAWVNVGSIQGPQGPQGPAGPQGPIGPQGLTGEQGPQGIQGIQGEQGPEGPQGPQGIQGVSGVAGKSAYSAAVEAGYAGTETTFNEALSEVPGHMKDYTLQIPYGGTTEGVANAYTLANPVIEALNVGMAVSARIHAASTAAATLNWNGKGVKPIIKPGGGNPNLKANGVYTFRYDGTNFQLQGEGGEYGTAGASQVLDGYTIGTENGLVEGSIPTKAAATITPSTVDQTIAAGQYLSGDQTIASLGGDAAQADVLAGHTFSSNVAGRAQAGTMPNIGDNWQVANSVQADGALGRILLRPPKGYYKGDGEAKVLANDPNFIPANINDAVSMFNLQGTLKKVVSAVSDTNVFAAVNQLMSHGTLTMLKVCETTIMVDGTYRISYDLGGNGVNLHVYAQIYKNNVAYGVYRDYYTSSTQERIHYTEDLTFNAGDKIQLYTQSGFDGFDVEVGYFKVYSSIGSAVSVYH